MRTITLSMIDRTQYDENESGQPIETTKPVVLSGKDGSSDFRYLVMPVRIPG